MAGRRTNGTGGAPRTLPSVSPAELKRAGRQLKEWRETVGWTQKEAAQKLDERGVTLDIPKVTTSTQLWASWERGVKGPTRFRARVLVDVLTRANGHIARPDLLHIWWPGDPGLGTPIGADALSDGPTHYALDGTFVGLWGFLDDSSEPVIFRDELVDLRATDDGVKGVGRSKRVMGAFSTDIVVYDVDLRIDGMGVAHGHWRNQQRQSEFMGVILGYITQASTQLDASWTATHYAHQFLHGRLRWYRTGPANGSRKTTVEQDEERLARLVEDLRQARPT